MLGSNYSDPKGTVIRVADYGEASFFDGFHFAHIAAWLEHLRLKRIDTHIQRHSRWR